MAKLIIHCAHNKIIPIGQLRVNPDNPNEHSKEQIERLAFILKAQGWRTPITISSRSGFIVRGHGRLAAAEYLGVSEAPVDYQPYGSEGEETADLIADNKASEGSETLPTSLGALLDVMPTHLHKATGWTPEEIMASASGSLEKGTYGNFPVTLVEYPCSPEESSVIRRAIAKIKRGVDMSDGRAIELICAEYLS